MRLKFFKTWLYREIAENQAKFSQKINYLFLILGIVLPSLVLIYFWPDTSLPAKSASSPVLPGNSEPIKPIPISLDLDYQKVELGEKLFFDKRLSKDNSVSCASCHDLNLGGTDKKKFSKGINNSNGSINSPTVLNAGFNFKQFWNGRAESLEEQTEGPINNPLEMGSNWNEVIAKLTSDNEYVSKFKLIYKSDIKAELIQNAIAEFERSLFTPNSRFDQYLRGDTNAIDEDELAGYNLFKNLGCSSCHQGLNIGGNMYQTFGISGDYFSDRGNLTEVDYGLYNITKNESDKFVFKVPSLRNINLTAPYLHDGSAETLEDAVRIMSIYQLGRTLSSEESEKIVKFLKTLTGELKGKRLE
ncbi:MAG: cytochrome-c peroxidase [Spirochaetia bacterium]|nr:cytochrome-c peroxidase [Spirochaetia bacterium]